MPFIKNSELRRCWPVARRLLGRRTPSPMAWLTTPKRKGEKTKIYGGRKLVGARGFEPPTPCAQGRCADRAALRPDLSVHTIIRGLSKERRVGASDAAGLKDPPQMNADLLQGPGPVADPVLFLQGQFGHGLCRIRAGKKTGSYPKPLPPAAGRQSGPGKNPRFGSLPFGQIGGPFWQTNRAVRFSWGTLPAGQ